MLKLWEFGKRLEHNRIGEMEIRFSKTFQATKGDKLKTVPIMGILGKKDKEKGDNKY